jgi:hypothetical protein
MAQRRMFSPDIVRSDAFLEMSASARELYFQLGMSADDDGFIAPRGVMRMVGSSEDDLKLLIAKRFAIPFESGVIVVKHWKINNLVRKDWYKPTRYSEEAQLLYVKENMAYTLDSSKGVKFVNEPLTQVRLGKVINTPAKAVLIVEEENSVERKTKQETSPYEGLCKWAESRRGFKFVRKLKQYSSLKVAREANISPGKLKERWIQQEGEAWRQGNIDWTTVVSSFDKHS